MLQTGGTISFNDIRTELGIPSQTDFSISGAVNNFYVPLNLCSPLRPHTWQPYAVTDWYGYCHTCNCACDGDFKRIIWYATTLNKTIAYFDLGTSSGSVTVYYNVINGAASLNVLYSIGGGGLTGIVSSNGSISWGYTYDGSSSIVGIEFDSRSNSAIDQIFDVNVSCPPFTPTDNIKIENTSLDITITTFEIDGVTVPGIYASSGGESEHYLSTDSTVDVLVSWISFIGGQHISIYDTNGTFIECHNVSVGDPSPSYTFMGIDMTGPNQLLLEVGDGTC